MLIKFFKISFPIWSILILASCTFTKPRLTVFIIDTSGSMKVNNLLEEVKTSIRETTLDWRPGDQFHIVTFDEQAHTLAQVTVRTAHDLAGLFKKLDTIKANGQWTNHVAAINHAVSLSVDLVAKKELKVNLVMYTDGIHDPPPHLKSKKEVDFQDLFSKYFDKDKKFPWFIYYVELKENDAKLKEALVTTGFGEILTTDKLQSSENFMTLEYNIFDILMASGLALLGFLIFLIARPWYRKGILVPQVKHSKLPSDGQIYLAMTKRKFFSRKVSLGLNGDIPIDGPGVEELHAELKNGLFGALYVISREGVVKVDGEIVQRKSRVRSGQKVEIGGVEYVYLDSDS